MKKAPPALQRLLRTYFLRMIVVLTQSQLANASARLRTMAVRAT